MKTGDVISFSGKSRVSNFIKGFTSSDISHVGMILETDFINERRVFLIESTSLLTLPDEKTAELLKGVQIHLLSNRLKFYNGQVYWHSLKKSAPKEKEMVAWLNDRHGKRVPYDTIQAIGAGVDALDLIALNNEPDFSALFCSELVSKALQIGGVIPDSINPSEQTPKDVCSYNCLAPRVQLHI